MIRPSTGSLWSAIFEKGVAGSKRQDFLVTPDGRFSYADLGAGVRRWLQCFDEAGLEEGDRILIRTANEFAAMSCFIAALLDGIVPVQLSSDVPDERTRSTRALISAKMQVFDADNAPEDMADNTSTILLEKKAARSRFKLGRKVDYLPGLAAGGAEREPRLPRDDTGLAYILFTSGTTSKPSGVMITRGNLFAQLATLTRLFGYDSSSRIFNDMVLSHADGLVQGPVLALANRCTLIRTGGFDLARLEGWLNMVRQERATHVITVPTVWSMIEAYAQHDDYFDAPECRQLLSVAAKLPQDLWSGIETRFGRPLFNQYGLTETATSALYAGAHSEMGAIATIGKPVDCEARIDPAAPASGEGELQLRGENIFSGYWQNPERTAASFTDDGWFKTGDLARLLTDGSYEMLARIKSVIMVGGFLIRPDELDEVMLRHPSVRESVTLGIEDAMFGEVPVTGVVLDEPVAAGALITHARAQLENRKVPKRIVVLDAIPRGDSGKPQLTQLRNLLVEADAGDGHDAGDSETAALAGHNIAAAVLSLAEDIFQAEPGVLNQKSRAGDLPGWDSFSQLNFVLAAEQQFSITIPASRIASIASISDMVATVEGLRG